MKWKHDENKSKEQKSKTNNSIKSKEKQKNGCNINLWDLGQRRKQIPTSKKSRHLTALLGKCVYGSLTILTLLLPTFLTVNAEISQSIALKVLIGEAANQGPKGMQAVAEVLRRRGGVRGFSALDRPNLETFLAKQPAFIWRQAEMAWKASKDSNLTKGATHYESTDFKTPYWARKMILTAHIGKHKFYKEARP